MTLIVKQTLLLVGTLALLVFVALALAYGLTQYVWRKTAHK